MTGVEVMSVLTKKNCHATVGTRSYADVVGMTHQGKDDIDAKKTAVVTRRTTTV